MENASKALIMTAGILIGILVISLAIYLFADFGATSAQINQQVEKQRIAQFNSQFTSYIDKDLTIYDIITILGHAQENNKYYAEIESEKISVIFDNIEITNYEEKNKEKLLKDEQKKMSSEGKLPTYKIKVTYNENTSKVKKVIFK